jgi:putative tryptophan/tyrosine transport system substrate-binding protein
MKRREFITLLGGAAAWPLAARAQQPAMPVVGFLSGRSLASDAHLVKAFREGLSERGYVEGQNVAIEFRWAESQFDRLPALAADLVGRKVAVVFAGGLDVSIRAIRAAISGTPVVFATSGDPVELGLVASFNRPGGNVTAVTLISAVLWPKRMELVRVMIGTPTMVALMVNPNNPTTEAITKDVQAAAQTLGLKTQVLHASTDRDIDAAFETLAQQRASALLLQSDPVFNDRRDKLVALAARHAMPAIYDRRDFPAAGGLMSYGASAVDQYRQSGLLVGRILKGAEPAELPVMQPTKFEFVINFKTAKALGLQIPEKLLALADEVIE